MFYVCECFVCIYVCAPRMWLVPMEGIRCLKTTVIDGCQPPCGFWELHLSPLQKRQVLLTTKTSLQSCIYFTISINTFGCDLDATPLQSIHWRLGCQTVALLGNDGTEWKLGHRAWTLKGNTGTPVPSPCLPDIISEQTFSGRLPHPQPPWQWCQVNLNQSHGNCEPGPPSPGSYLSQVSTQQLDAG